MPIAQVLSIALEIILHLRSTVEHFCTTFDKASFNFVPPAIMDQYALFKSSL
jgi:hypothetical protein